MCFCDFFMDCHADFSNQRGNDDKDSPSLSTRGWVNLNESSLREFALANS
ncbi:hypothetical protein [Helicobacter sp. T3_23-1059]